MVRKKLPELDAYYNRRRRDGEFYKLLRNNEKGMYAVAARDIGAHDLILIEKSPLHSQPSIYQPSFLSRPDVVEIMHTILPYAQSEGHQSGVNKYPPEARKAMDRLMELSAKEYMVKSPGINEIWELHDAHRNHQEIGDLVQIDGLISEAGKQLNGLKGVVVCKDEHEADRLGIELRVQQGKELSPKSQYKSIKRCNLKSLGGIARTNSFEGENSDSLVLYRILSRFNHACGDSANATRIIVQNGAYLFSRQPIEAGEEILIDYIPNEKPEDRLDLLQLKYNFQCNCPQH